MAYNLSISFLNTCVFSLLYQDPSGPYCYKVYPVATVKHLGVKKGRKIINSEKECNFLSPIKAYEAIIKPSQPLSISQPYANN